jgi:hypothetical protein
MSYEIVEKPWFGDWKNVFESLNEGKDMTNRPIYYYFLSRHFPLGTYYGCLEGEEIKEKEKKEGFTYTNSNQIKRIHQFVKNPLFLTKEIQKTNRFRRVEPGPTDTRDVYELNDGRLTLNMMELTEVKIYKEKTKSTGGSYHFAFNHTQPLLCKSTTFAMRKGIKRKVSKKSKKNKSKKNKSKKNRK